jgi:hypothetical protein
MELPFYKGSKLIASKRKHLDVFLEDFVEMQWELITKVHCKFLTTNKYKRAWI